MLDLSGQVLTIYFQVELQHSPTMHLSFSPCGLQPRLPDTFSNPKIQSQPAKNLRATSADPPGFADFASSWELAAPNNSKSSMRPSERLRLRRLERSAAASSGEFEAPVTPRPGSTAFLPGPQGGAQASIQPHQPVNATTAQRVQPSAGAEGVVMSGRRGEREAHAAEDSGGSCPATAGLAAAAAAVVARRQLERAPGAVKPSKSRARGGRRAAGEDGGCAAGAEQPQPQVRRVVLRNPATPGPRC